MMFAQYFVHRDDRSHAYRIFQYLLECYSEQLAGKVVRWLHDYMLILGYMPSGSLETSHGDTWIMINYYWLGYIFHEMSIADVETRKKIWYYMKRRQIVALFFGDDFLAVIPRVLLGSPLSGERFAEYLNIKHDVKLKSLATHGSLLTYLKVWKNEVIGYDYKGPTYLKRKFLDSRNFNLSAWEPQIAPIVPWRPFTQYQWRAGMPTDRSAPVYMNLSRLLGLLYDTLGIDPVAYAFLAYLYHRTNEIGVRLTSPEFIKDNLPKWVESDQKYLRKIGYKIEVYECPTRAFLLQLNVLDREYHRPRFPNIRKWQEAMWDTEFAF